MGVWYIDYLVATVGDGNGSAQSRSDDGGDGAGTGTGGDRAGAERIRAIEVNRMKSVKSKCEP